MLAIIAGFQLMRRTIGLSAFADADPKALTRLLGAVLQQVMDDGTKLSG